MTVCLWLSQQIPTGQHCRSATACCLHPLCRHPAGLADLTGLQHLTLSDLDTKQASAVNSDWFPVPGAIFSTLGSLTHLELDKCVASSTLEHLEHLTNLQHLVLSRLGVSAFGGTLRPSGGGGGGMWPEGL